jgi:site-specific DNA-methyltransferase (adenine-specific)
MDGMRDKPDKYYDLAIVDPEYGINADIKNNGANSDNHRRTSLAKLSNYKTGWDTKIPNVDYFNELKRVSKDQIIWGANYFGLVGGYIFWDKLVTMPTYSDGELAYCSKLNSVRKFEYQWHGMLQEDMKNKEKRIHPTQKPVALYKWLLKNYAKEGDKILDTHGGSMSSVIACLDMGFSITCYEKDPDYFFAAKKRILNHMNQTNLFSQTAKITFE